MRWDMLKCAPPPSPRIFPHQGALLCVRCKLSWKSAHRPNSSESGLAPLNASRRLDVDFSNPFYVEGQYMIPSPSEFSVQDSPRYPSARSCLACPCLTWQSSATLTGTRCATTHRVAVPQLPHVHLPMLASWIGESPYDRARKCGNLLESASC